MDHNESIRIGERSRLRLLDATAELAGSQYRNLHGARSPQETLKMNLYRLTLLMLVVATLPLLARAQAVADSMDSSSSVTGTNPANPAYVRPTEKTKLRNYLFDAFGPYPLVGAAIAGGVNQVENAPPEW